MIKSLPKLEMPKWLARVGEEDQLSPIPWKEMLIDSLYYPSSEFDGDPIKHLSGNFYSFVYVDYGISRHEFKKKLKKKGFKGYHSIQYRDITEQYRDITEQDLTSNGCKPIPPNRHDSDPTKYRDWIKKPFANWSVFQRNDGLDSEHGAERFSLLYLCADGVAAFQALYISHYCFPLGIAIIQPGTGFGFNWTDYTNPDEALGEMVLNNQKGKPKILLYGGIGRRHWYGKPCWPQYSEHIHYFEKSRNNVRKINLTEQYKERAY